MSVVIDVKHKILSFLQTYFANKSSAYPWSSTYSQSKIVIADKFAVDLESIQKKPAIIMARGQTRWAKLTLDQRDSSSITTHDKVFKDLVRVSFTLNVLGKNGIALENIAGTLFDILVGYKDVLKEVGIHQINAIEVGQEEAVQVTSEIDLTRVPVSVVVSMARKVSSYEDFFCSTVTASGETLPETEKVDYDIVGQTIVFYTASGVEGEETYSINYLDNVDLSEHTETLAPSGVGYYLPLTFPAFASSGVEVRASNSSAVDHIEYLISGNYITTIENPSDATEITNIKLASGYVVGLPSGVTADNIYDVFKVNYYLDADTHVQRYILLRSGTVDYAGSGIYGDYYAGSWGYDSDETLSTYTYVSGIVGVISN